ncbi:hypothetical protein HDA32_001124 [Spinactinospora alkalitolerans]|uniref:HEPN domain-containing protein n=1 Tax=Spinactinospora alkalitolerans TaxID=687207 RepID=A0A852TV82_9ACTN|nr:hypothetical protein [Spinactinospora alkalitolerans]NYE46004.1 hypothetical protein [Spinactinospora alkalitolerans]
MAIEVSIPSLKAAYATHRDTADSLGSGVSACLLRFYAVECALKAALLRRENKRSTADLEKRDRSHDLRALAIRLRLPRHEIESLIDCTLKSDSGRRVAPEELHEVWRYGAALRDEDQKRMEATLLALLTWVRREPGL